MSYTPEEGAETTPVPVDARAAARRRRRRRLTATITVALALTAGGGYTAACALAPLPELQIEPTIAADETFAADEAGARAVVDSHARPTAIGWLHGEEVWANDDDAHPIASISKLVTVLVAQEAAPLEPGVDGPVYTWTEADRQLQEELLAVDGIAYPIPVGTEVTTRQMLQLSLIPSANDFATAYARSVFGDDDAFVSAVEDWKSRHGLDSLELVEPSGMSTDNRASAGDVLRIARMVLENPTLAEIVRTPSAEMPWGIGTVENTNPLLGALPGVIGVKTGTTSSAGFNLVTAQEYEAAGRELVRVSVVLGRDSEEERASASGEVLAAFDSLPQTVEALPDSQQVGEITTWTGETVPVVAQQGWAGTLLPGEEATRELALEGPTPQGGDGITSGSRVGSITVTSPTGAEEIPALTAATIEEPDLWWRLTNPGALFG